MELRGKFLIAAVFICFISLSSCRKDINEEPGITSYSGEDQNNGSGGNGTGNTQNWTKIISSETGAFNCLQAFNSQLYVGGTFVSGGVKFLGKVNGSQLLTVSTLSFGRTGIYDLEVHENNLYIAGSFSISAPGNYSYNLVKLNTAGTLSSLPFAIGISDYIYSLNSSGNELLIAGDFSPGTSNSCVTENIDKLVNNVAQGFGGYTTAVYKIRAYGSKYLGVNFNNKPIVNSGSGWGLQSYQSSNPSDFVVDLCAFEDSLYFFGSFWKKPSIKSFSASGNVRQHDVRITSQNRYNGFKVLDGKIYAFGTGIISNGVYKSNVLVKDSGGKWQPLGNLKETVNDIEYFNGKIYAATTNGIYEF